MFPCGTSSACVLTKLLSKCPSSHKPPIHVPWKVSCCIPALRHCSFCGTLSLKCLTVFWIRPCLDSCSSVCTVTLCYELHQAHSEFWHIQHSVFSGICRHIQSYSAFLRHISRSLRHYWGIFGLIQHPAQLLHIQNLRYIQNSVKAYFNIPRTLCNVRILRTRPYLEFCYIQNFGILRTRCIFIQAYSIMIFIITLTLFFSI